MIAPNKRIWEVGDIVIHEDDEKIESMLMRIIDVLNVGLAKTVYIHPKGNVGFYQYYMTRLHDPLKFGMTSTLSFSQELELRIENMTKSITSPDMDVDEIRYLRVKDLGSGLHLIFIEIVRSEVDNGIHI